MALPQGALGKRLVAECADFSPTLVFMQLQTAGVLTPEALQHAKTFCPEATFVTWCGDIGRDNGPVYTPSSWYIHELAKAGLDLALYSSWTQVVAHRTHGLDIAAYLQIGYDEDVYYYPGEPPEAALHDVVFLGQNYQDAAWPTVPGNDIQLRRDVVSALRETFGERFGLFGSGWKGAEYVTSLNTRQLYTFAKAAVSLSLVSTYDKYSSDRLLRSLACACPTFVKRFYDMASWGLVDGINCIVWDTTSELVDKLKAFLSESSSYRWAIGLSGAQFIKRNHTWGVRMREMLPLVYALGRE